VTLQPLQRRIGSVTREAVMSRIRVFDDDPMICMAIETISRGTAFRSRSLMVVKAGFARSRRELRSDGR
jgi:hypothetical protein